MKANELRIGNIVGYQRTPYLVLQTNVLAVSTLGISLNENSQDGSSYPKAIEDIFPVELTEDILLRCGARRLPHGYFINKLKFTYEINELSQFVRFHYSGKVVYIQYLHQLQNLYFAITNTELEITSL